MKIKKFVVTTLCVLTVGILDGYSQYSQKAIHRNLLSPTLATTLCKDSAGFIWMGTNNGIKRYDGFTETEYRFPGKKTDVWEIVNVLTEIPHNRLMIGNRLGLWILEKKKQQIKKFFAEEIKFPVLALANSENKCVYIGTTNGLYCFDPEKDKLVHLFSGADLEKDLPPILHISVDTQGMVWLLTHQSILSYNPRNGKTKSYPSGAKYVMNSGVHMNNQFYLSTEEGKIIRFNPVDYSFSELTDLKKNISCLARFNPEVLIAGTEEDGLYFISTSTSKVVHTERHHPQDKNSLSSNSILSLFVDEFQHIWIGSKFYTGLDVLKYKIPLFKTYSCGNFSTNGLSVRSFYIDGRVKLIGTREGLYYIDEKQNRVKCYKKEEGLRSNIIFSLTNYDGKYFIGTCKGGVSVLDPNTLQISNLNNFSSLFSGDVFSFYKDRYSRLWIASTNGLHCYNKANHSLKTYTHTNSGLPDNGVLFIYEDSQKRVWVTTSKGVCFLNTERDTFTPVELVNSFIGAEGVRSVFEDKNGDLYLGMTVSRKLLRVNKELTNCAYLEKTPEGSVLKDSLFHETPWNGTLDDKGNVWMISSIGIMQADPHMRNWRLFTKKDGLPDPVIVDGSTCFKAPGGTLWFATMKGLVYTDSIPSRSSHPKNTLLINYVKANGVLLAGPDSPGNIDLTTIIKLANDQKNIGIHFIPLDYEWNDESTIYEYKLEGFDSQWNRQVGHKEINYTNLPAGKYTFHVRRFMDPDSTGNLQFEIESSSTPFHLAITLLIVTGIGIFIGWYRKQRGTRTNAHPSGNEKPEDKYKNIKIPESRAKEIIEKLTRHLEDEKPYTNPNLKIHDLATAIACSTPILSQIFNQYLNTRFYDYIAKYRVEEFKRLIEESDYGHYTLTALGEKSGFNSQASFFRSFKKITGLTPSEYIKARGK